MSLACGVNVTPSMRNVLRDLNAGYRVERYRNNPGVLFVGDLSLPPRESGAQAWNGHKEVRIGTLHALVDRGMVARKAIPAAKYYLDGKPVLYTITKKGRKAVKELEFDDIPF